MSQRDRNVAKAIVFDFQLEGDLGSAQRGERGSVSRGKDTIHKERAETL